jgi:hypothetical protein
MTNIVLYIFCFVIFLFASGLTVIYCTDIKFRKILYYFNTYFALIIAVNNLIRLIPLTKDNDQVETSTACKIQAFFLAFFDKLMLTSMTSFSFIWCYVILYKEEIKNKNKERTLYVFSNSFGGIISFVCSLIFSIQGNTSDRSEFCYVDTRNEVKQWLDSIVTLILFIINLVCFIIILTKIKEMKRENREMVIKEVYSYDLKIFILGLILNIIIFIYVFLLIIKKLPFDNFFKDLIYVFLSFCIDLYIIVNEELIDYLRKCFRCEKKDEANNDSDKNMPFTGENNTNNEENNI